MMNDKNKNLVAGILAHVDAGKTTLSEAMLYLSGKIKKLGRVDHRDSFLDNHSLERARGITIFSKQALIELENSCFTLLDTPGHVDFSSEMERSLQVLDCAVLVISGTDGVQAHTETLWRLLRQYSVPCMIFITKMDLSGCDKVTLMRELAKRLDSGCIDFTNRDDSFYEQLAMCSEEVMEKYLEDGSVSDDDIAALISQRRLFPCFFGSGLRLEGVEELLSAMDSYVNSKDKKEEFAAKVYKIARDAQGNRLTYVKITGGELKVRTPLKYKNEKGADFEEKINQIRLYSGIKFDAVDTAVQGQVCALTGLTETYPGQGLGAEPDSSAPVLEPVISYTVKLPAQADPAVVFPKLSILQEEDPQLHISWNERSKEISVQLMGKVQTEIFKSLVKERFDLEVELDAGHIMYRETIADTVEGVGHYEPLRHYAEVHLIMEPLPQGSGIVLDSCCSEDKLDRNWQRLILSHIQEKQHLGVLTGSPITDMKISLAAGRAHDKHTEGGDFRQATYRAIRQGLMQAESILLEPYYSFVIEVPPEQIGRAISDVRAMNGTFSSPEDADGFMRIEGSAPVAAMNGYMTEIVSYTHGKGRFSCRPDGYRPCKDQQKIIEEIGYDAEGDVDNTADSVFCAHGAGVNIKWNEVPDYMHLESCLREVKEPDAPVTAVRRPVNIDDRELEAIMEREFGPIRRKEYKSAERNEAPDYQRNIGSGKKEFLIVDGYNLIFAWDELKKIGEDGMDVARQLLKDKLSNYCAFTKTQMVLVFDAYKTAGGTGAKEEYDDLLRIAYTKDGETADAYIERIANEIGTNFSVRVITGDSLIRLSTMRSGVLNSSSRAFKGEVEEVLKRMESFLAQTNQFAHKTRLKDGKQ